MYYYLLYLREVEQDVFLSAIALGLFFFLNLWLKVSSSLSTKKIRNQLYNFCGFLNENFVQRRQHWQYTWERCVYSTGHFASVTCIHAHQITFWKAKQKIFNKYTCSHKHTKVTKDRIMPPPIQGEVYCSGLVVCLSVTNLCLLWNTSAPEGIFK